MPLLAALPVLAALDPATRVPLHASARTWAAAARSALEAIAARRVYPALDDEGRDCWRLAADTAVTSPGLTGRSWTRSPTRCCGRRGHGW